MKKLALLLSLSWFILTAAFGQEIATGKIKFAYTSGQLSGSIWTLQDTTIISADSSAFKSLLVIKGKVLFDTTNKNEFRLVGANQLFAKVGNGELQLLWHKTSTDTFNISINNLITDSGINIANGASVRLNGVPVRVNKLYLKLPTDSALANSYVEINGRLFLPETGGSIFYDFADTNRISIFDTLNYAKSFSQSIDTSFYIRNSGYSSNNLILNYNENSQLFSLYGSVVYRIDSNDIPAMLGDSVHPGIVYTNGSLSKVQLTVSDTFRLFKQKFHPQGFTISLNSADSTYSLYGGLGVETEQSIIRIQLGDSLNPGCLGKNNRLLQFRASLPDTFNIRNLSFLPQNLTFAYDTSSASRFYMFGGVTCLIKNDSTGIHDSIIATFGEENNAGLVISDGQLQQLSVGISNQFKLKGITFNPDTVCFVYRKPSQTYALFGRLGVSFDSTQYHIAAGDINNPGIAIGNGKLIQLRVTVDDTIKVRGFEIKPNQLTFKYDSISNNSFSVYGNAVVMIKGDSTSSTDTINVGLGNESNPGMMISDGTLQNLNLEVSTKFRLKNIEMEADSLRFQYDASVKQFEMFGGIKAEVDSISYQAQLGDDNNPGIVFNKNKLVKLQFTISDTITIKNVRFKPAPLTFSYDTTDNNTFKLYGNAVAILQSDSGNLSDTIYCTAGDEANPGILINNGALQQLNFGVSGHFSINKLFVMPDSLNVQYSKNNNTFGIYGRAKFGIENDTLNIEAGDESNPGIQFANNRLQSINISLTDTFKIKTLALVPRGLTFQYNRNNARYSIFGNVTGILEGDTVYGKLGDNTSPGFEYQQGKISKLNIAVIGNFNLKKLKFSSGVVNPVTFQFNKDSQQYEIYGTTILEFDSNKMEVNIGDEQKPGIVFSNNSLKQINIGLTDTFKLRSLIFNPQHLTFRYNKDSAMYELFGAAKLAIKSDSVLINLGTDSLPGIKVANGELQDINIGLEADFKLKGIEIHPKNLSFYYSKNRKTFGMYGALDIRFDSNTIDMEMGDISNPGLAFNTANGDLENLNLTTTDTLKLYSLVLRPVNFAFKYNKADQRYEMSGSVMAAFRSDSVLLSIGNVDTPGFIYQNGELTKLELTVVDSLNLYGLSMKSKGLTCSYIKSDKQYKIYGDVSLHFSNETIEANLGTKQKPGLLIQNSVVQSINFGINAKFKIGVVEFDAQNVTLQYDRDSNYYEMFGAVSFTLENETVSANLGTNNIPGFTIRNGELYEMNISINSNLSIGGLKVNTHDVGMYYTRTNDGSKYIIRGTVTVNELWSVSTTLGVPGDATRGLEIIEQNGVVKVDVTDFVIEAQHISLGGVTFNDLYVSYTQKTGGFGIDAKVDVSFPPGFEIGGQIAFSEVNNKFTLDTINLMYDAGTTEGIEIGETGVFITHLNGGVSLLAGTTSDYTFNGGIVVVAGGKFTLGNESFAMLRIEGDVVIDKNHLNIKDIIDVAAYQSDGKWEGLYGSGVVELDLNWTTGEYKVDGDLKYYSVVEFKSEAYYHSNQTMGAMGEVDLIVPDFIPVIGGKTLAGIDGAVRYNKHDLNNSVAAGWTNVDLVVKKVTAGAEYNFGRKKVKAIGQKDVNNLNKEISSDGQAERRHYTFTVPDYVHTVTINIRPVNPSAYQYLMVMLRDQSFGIDIGCDLELFTPVPGIFGRFNISQMLAQTFFQGGPKLHNSIYYGINVDSLTVNGLALHFQGTALDRGELVPAGEYTLATSFSVESAPLFTVEIQNHYLEPEGHARGQYNKETRQIDVDFDAVLFTNDTATITIYQSETNKYNGAILGSAQLGAPGSQGKIPYAGKFSYAPPRDSVVITYDSLRRPINKLPTILEKDVYLYAVINDGVNLPVYTSLHGPVRIKPDFYMSLTPENVRTMKVGNQLKGMVDLGMNLQYPENEKSHYRVSIYYDFDNNGHNGYPVNNLQNLTINQIENSDTAFGFVIDDLIKAGSNSTYYFYAVVSGTGIAKGYTSSYSAPVSFNAPLLVNVKYLMDPNLGTSKASGIKVWLDLNNNQKYDDGIDAAHITDYNGQCGFFTATSGTFTVGLLLDSATAINNPNLKTQTLTINNNGLSSANFIITHKAIKIEGTYRFLDAKNNKVDPRLYASFGEQNNYFFADLNGNNRFDNNEPRVFNNLSETFEFTINQPNVLIYFVDEVSRIKNIPNQNRFSAKGLFKVNNKIVNGGGNQYQTGAMFDAKMSDNDTINVFFDGLMDRLKEK